MKSRARIAVATLWLVGYGPFVCAHADVEDANAKIAAGEAEAALAILDQVADVGAEVHLSRGTALVALEKWDDAAKAYDEAYRLTVVGEGELEEDEDPARFQELRRRIAFGRGLVAVGKEDWAAAQVEFARVLALDPTDEAARLNLELAWHHANPPCHKRDDDSEPNDNQKDAKPLTAEGAKDRVLCPANDDWFAMDVQREQGSPPPSFYVTLEGEVDTSEDQQRAVELHLFSPNRAKARRSAKLKDGKASVGVTYVRDLGAWTVQITGAGQAEMKYSLRYEVVPPCPVDDGFEENDDADSAAPVPESNPQQPPPGAKACPGDPDWYSFSVPANAGRILGITFDADRAPLKAEVFDGERKSLGEAKASKQGLQFHIPQVEGTQPDDENPAQRAYLVRVDTAEDRENTYAIALQPDDQGDDGDDGKQDPGEDEQDQQQQPQPKPQPQEMTVDQLIDQLDKQKKNPQLEKALQRAVIPRGMEDY